MFVVTYYQEHCQTFFILKQLKFILLCHFDPHVLLSPQQQKCKVTKHNFCSKSNSTKAIPHL